MRDSGLPPPRRARAAWLLSFTLVALALLPGPAPTAAQEDPTDMQARGRNASAKNLKQIGLALHAFSDKE